jgi:hypothetical protein
MSEVPTEEFKPDLDRLEHLSEELLQHYQAKVVLDYYRESVRVIRRMYHLIEQRNGNGKPDDG